MAERDENGLYPHQRAFLEFLRSGKPLHFSIPQRRYSRELTNKLYGTRADRIIRDEVEPPSIREKPDDVF